MRNVCLGALALLLLPVSALAQSASAPQPAAPSGPPQSAPQQPATPPAPSTPAAPASAATQKYFVAVHIGGQAGSSTLRDTFTFSIYDETAEVIDDQDYGGGFLFNIEGGYRFMPRWAAGLAITRTSGEMDTRLSATIPHPQVFDQPRLTTLDLADTTHSETGYHFFVAYLFPVKPGIDVRAFAGPSILSVTHDLPLVTGNHISDPAPFTSVTLTGAALEERKETLGAFHFGVGATYAITDRLGVDGFFRFARRTTDVPGISAGTVELKAGGAQFGVGVTVGF